MVLSEIARRAASAATLEALLVSSIGFGLTTASPLQRAICCIAEGRPVPPEAAADVAEYVGDYRPGTQPRELVIASGIRTAKSMIAAMIAIRATQTVDLSGLKRSEIPRVPVVSLSKDLAAVVYGHVRTTIETSQTLRHLLLAEPTADALMLRHPDDRPVEIKIVAGGRAGEALVARWLASIIYDEGFRMVGREDGVVNLDDMRHAVKGRLLPGAQEVLIGSPWAPFGPGYDLIQAHHMNPTGRTVVVWAPAHKLNPVWWTPETMAELEAMNPDAYRTDVLAQFMEPSELWFSAQLLEAAIRRDPPELPREPGCTYVAGMDPATRSNAWTLAIGTRDGQRRKVAKATQWIPARGAPLDPRDTLAQIAQACAPYGVRQVFTDQWAIDALRPLAADVGLDLVQIDHKGREAPELYGAVRQWLVLGELELPPVPELVEDLKRVQRRITQNGIAVVLPTTNDGRHCDYVPALVRMLHGLNEDRVAADPPEGSPEWEQRTRARMRRAAEDRARRRPGQWFEKGLA